MCNKILVVLSSSNNLMVCSTQDRKLADTPHETGYFLSELAVPVMYMIQSGFTMKFASPTGCPAHTQPDPVSLSARWFADAATYEDARRFEAINSLVSIGDIDVRDFVGIFVPGGHAPMVDLTDQPDLGRLLLEADQRAMPIGAICHGPIALLSSGDYFKGRTATCFSKAEEEQEESGGDNALGGYVPFYPTEALEKRGIEILVREKKWQPHVVCDGGLVTGQNPMSDDRFAVAFARALRSSQ
jgi:putative intracellular protease/amidase